MNKDPMVVFPNPDYSKYIVPIDNSIDIYNVMDKYKDKASWAIWNSAIGFNKESMRRELKYGCVLVALNASSSSDGDWSSFHKTTNDIRLKKALVGTEVWGCYITDLIKDKIESDSKAVLSDLSDNEDAKYINGLLEELATLGNVHFLIALGDEVYKRLINSSRINGNLKIIKIPHYAAPKYYGDDNIPNYINDVNEVLGKYKLADITTKTCNKRT